MRNQRFATIILSVAMLATTYSGANGAIILGDRTSSDGAVCMDTSGETKVDNGVILTLTGVILTFTGVILTLTGDKDTGNTNCGIILSD